jgi:hypothetical protein
MPKLKYPTKSHPGRAGRKPAPLPYFLKKLRATKEERQEFIDFMTGDASRDFRIILEALRVSEGAGRKPQEKGKE